VECPVEKPMKVAVAMSGGVDSSAAAAILLDQGHTLAGVTFRLFGCEIARAADGKSCCSQEDVADAMRVSMALGIDHEVIDFSERFAQDIIDPFAASYAAGRTPNPCILCNQHIKFSAFLDWALEAGFDAIATGHHARIEHDGSRWQLRAGEDSHKDQTYFLFPLDQISLPHVLFPVGSFTKPEVRKIAASHSLPVAEKSESQDVCFAAGGSYAEFLEEHAGLKPLPGQIVLVDGTPVGQHEGLHRYTVGQRKGLGVAWRQPLYVVGKEIAQNLLIVGERNALDCSGILADNAIWTGGTIPAAGTALTVRIRYRSAATPATVVAASAEDFSLQFASSVQGVATGQAAVLYDGDTVVGGGWIASVDGA
jgi:tRNA-uridine 2-sulfurtransferase